ncbi:MAG: DUF6362 family protein [Sideroxydans sp.]|nr:DUF6362 family protein [Sideroxydans sp.]
MAERNTAWTPDDVANRFEDAAVTARRLPSANVQGYFNAWPTIVRCQWEMLATDERVACRFQPTPKDVEDMLEVMLWVQWLEVEQRHLVWMRAKRYGWREISIRFACCTKTAQRHWQQALQLMVDHLNESSLTRQDARR